MHLEAIALGSHYQINQLNTSYTFCCCSYAPILFRKSQPLLFILKL